jgi:hypothetical protein
LGVSKPAGLVATTVTVVPATPPDGAGEPDATEPDAAADADGCAEAGADGATDAAADAEGCAEGGGVAGGAGA